MRRIDCAHSRSVKTLPWPWFRKSGECIEAKIKHFRIFMRKPPILGFSSRGIDCAHSRTVNMLPYSGKKLKNRTFRFKIPIPSLNQDQESVFTVRECAQSIFRLEKPKNRQFSHKNSKMFIFALIHRFPLIRVKKAFLRFRSARNHA